MVHVLMENRTGLPVAGCASVANPAEWEAACELLEARAGGVDTDHGRCRCRV
jgi:hypothetical protein